MDLKELAAIFTAIIAGLAFIVNWRKTSIEIKKTRLDIKRTNADIEKAQMEAKKTEAITDDKLKHQSAQIHYIQSFLLRKFITEPEIDHLRKLLSKERWVFTIDSTTSFFLNELRNLRALKLIEGYGNTGIRSLERDQGGDINTHFRITSEGEELLRLLRETESNIPKVMI